MKRRLVMLGAMAVIFGGCAKVQTEGGEEWGSVPRNQSKPLSAVAEKAKELRPGMTKEQVRRMLGEPARLDEKNWTYLPNQGGGITLDKKLIVKFFGDSYVSHTFRTTFATDFIYPAR